MWNELHFNADGLLPAIVQDAASGQVLMLAYMNAEALQRTLESGESWFWSRSRGELWHKGATSGNIQSVDEIRYDCDADALLLRVHPAGPACHSGETSCFYRVMESGEEGKECREERAESGSAEHVIRDTQDASPFTFSTLYEIIRTRKDAAPENSYTARLFAAGLPKIAQKVGEEAAEVLVAALAQEDRRLVEEAADLIYHTLVLLAARGLSPADVEAELARRHQPQHSSEPSGETTPG